MCVVSGFEPTWQISVPATSLYVAPEQVTQAEMLEEPVLGLAVPASQDWRGVAPPSQLKIQSETLNKNVTSRK